MYKVCFIISYFKFFQTFIVFFSDFVHGYKKKQKVKIQMF